MSKLLGVRLPGEVHSAFDGKDLEDKVGEAYFVATVDEDGTPRPCMLSAGEVLAVDEQTLRFGLWRGTNTAANLRRGSAVLLCYVDRDTVLYIKGDPKTLERTESAPIDRFEIKIRAIESDIHEGLPVVHGIKFACGPGMRERMLKEWSRTLDALRED